MEIFYNPFYPSPRRYTTTKYDGGEFELFPGFVDFECPTIFIRTGEVILNRAEAYAKSGEDGKA